MGKSLTEVAKSILMKEETSNQGTLKAGGGAWAGSEPDPKKNDATLVADAPKSAGEGSNVGASAAAPVGKDKSKAGQASVPAEQPKHLEEDEEIEGDVVLEDSQVELGEELEAFIDAMIDEGASEEEILEAIEENFELVSEEASEEIAEESAEYDYEVDMNEHVEALFAGEDLSEEFMEKAVTIFEAAVKSKMQSEIARLEEAYAEVLEEEVEAIKEELSSNVDDYLNYVVEQWVSENEVAIESGLRSELTEEFISGLRQLFAEHYIDIPEDKISVVEEMGSKIDELESKLNEEIERNVELTKYLNESKKNEILLTMVEGLTVTQAEKLKDLAENVEFFDADTYAAKVKTLRENYFHSSVTAQTELDRIEPGTEGQAMIAEENNPMSKYVRALGKSLPK